MTKKQRALAAELVELAGRSMNSAYSQLAQWKHLKKLQAKYKKISVDCTLSRTKREEAIRDLGYVENNIGAFIRDNPNFRSDAPDFTNIQVMALDIQLAALVAGGKRSEQKLRYRKPGLLWRVWYWITGNKALAKGW